MSVTRRGFLASLAFAPWLPKVLADVAPYGYATGGIVPEPISLMGVPYVHEIGICISDSTPGGHVFARMLFAAPKHLTDETTFETTFEMRL